ncbi:hypothetical protein QBC44DRAFT_386813 [Cladorrhinum sp. PSN332]|nr:hypothetical protein QBC44DRAFT_386813 [Cladorrhinum sp. PSN332]
MSYTSGNLDISDYGPSEVYRPPQRQLVDIVIVHGLMGHPVNTWLHTNEEKASWISFGKKKQDGNGGDCYWPLLMGQELKCARVITYGYNSKPFSILAHSLGGILVKSALTESTKVRPDLADSCRAILFFGTPHNGSGWAEKGGYVANIVKATCTGSVKTQVLKSLSTGSETLTRITKDFNDLLVREGRPVPKYGIPTFIKGTGMASWGVTTKVVNNISSRYNRRDIEQEFTIETGNHVSMCRFESSKNRDYQQVISFFEEHFDQIREEINQEEAKIAAAAAAAAKEEEERVLAEAEEAAQEEEKRKWAEAEKVAQEEENKKRAEAEESTQTRESQQALLKALDYDQRLIRDRYLNRKAWAPESLDWIWDSEFGMWLNSQEPIFWIFRKPGSGKSTLTNYISRNHNLRARLPRNSLVLSHFFTYEMRQELGNNFAGLLRSLLHGILGEVPQVVPDMKKEFNLTDEQERAENWALNVGEVHKAFFWVTKEILRQDRCIMIFMDGLDELDQTHQWEATRFIKELNTMEVGRFKLCLSSRNIPPFTDTLASHPALLVNERNLSAIKAWAKQSLDLLEVLDDTKSLADIIANKSEGVFL